MGLPPEIYSSCTATCCIVGWNQERSGKLFPAPQWKQASSWSELPPQKNHVTLKRSTNRYTFTYLPRSRAA